MTVIVKVLNRYGKRKRGKKYGTVGMGYDVHKLTEGRDLILGGVKIPWELGLLGHSDADVVVHAIMDALLGAAALRDIGRHFPDTDPQYKGISSILLLQKVGALLKEKGYQIVNIDATIIAQKPKLLPHIDQMIKNVADALELSEDQVKYQSNHRRGTWIYRYTAGHFIPGNLLHTNGTGLTKKQESYKIIQTKRSQVLWPFFLYGKLQRTFHL